MTIFHRSAAKTWGVKFPNDAAYAVKEMRHIGWKYTTWEELHAERTQKQEANERVKRRHKKLKPCGIEVFFNDTFLFHGWYILVRTFKKSYYLNWRNPNPKVLAQVMELFPSSRLLFEEMKEELWCESFCKKYLRKHKNYKKGHYAFTTAWCKLDEYDNLINVFKK
jgi:hypothetical protein